MAESARSAVRARPDPSIATALGPKPMSEAPKHKPYVSASTILPELTPLPLLIGAVLGIIFGAASLYMAVRIGLTVSASIPVAVMSISIFPLDREGFRHAAGDDPLRTISCRRPARPASRSRSASR